MREIIFRGKRQDNMEWIEGDLLHPLNQETQGFYIVPIGCALHRMAEVFPETVGQYTGFTDKNGKRIFEGDVLLNSFVYDKWNVVWTDLGYEAWLIPNSGAIGHPDNEYPAHTENLGTINESFEVVGNIHDSPAPMIS